jgi:two-component system cell cycle response regulator
MTRDDLRVEILNQARQSLTGEGAGSAADAAAALKLLDALLEAIQRNTDPGEAARPARQVAGDLIQNRNLVFALQQQADELDALKKLSLNLTSSLDLQTVLDAVVGEAMRLVKNTRAVHIFLYSKGKLEFGASLDDQSTRNRPLSMPRADGLTNQVARTGSKIVVDDMQRHGLNSDAPADWAGSMIGLPLKTVDGIVGVMNLSKSTRGGFDPSELSLLELLADQAAIAISNASLHQAVSQQAYSDTVTGLPNRRALDDRLEQEVLNARRTGTSFAVIMMDVDGFKRVNDTHGHATGDQVLRGFFNYLATGLRTSDFLARYGGDELTLILSHTDPPAARRVVEKILEQVARFHFDAPNGAVIELGLSCGIALYPSHANTASNLLRAADEALYRVKKQCLGSYLEARGFTGELRREPA